MDSTTTSPPHTGFFASKLQKTKQNLTKFSNKAFNQYRDKQDSNTLNRSSYLSSNSANNINALSTSSTSSINSVIQNSKTFNSVSNLTSDNLDETITKANANGSFETNNEVKDFVILLSTTFISFNI